VLQNPNFVISIIEQEGDDDEIVDSNNINLPSLSVNSSIWRQESFLFCITFAIPD
jgi:hypothetical protein